VFVLLVDRRATVRARLLKRAATVAHHRYALVKGRNTRRLHVPRKVKPGFYRVSLKVVASGDTRRFTRRVRLRR
jgi:hypothetical protein